VSLLDRNVNNPVCKAVEKMRETSFFVKSFLQGLHNTSDYLIDSVISENQLVECPHFFVYVARVVVQMASSGFNQFVTHQLS